MNSIIHINRFIQLILSMNANGIGHMQKSNWTLLIYNKCEEVFYNRRCANKLSNSICEYALLENQASVQLDWGRQGLNDK